MFKRIRFKRTSGSQVVAAADCAADDALAAQGVSVALASPQSTREDKWVIGG